MTAWADAKCRKITERGSGDEQQVVPRPGIEPGLSYSASKTKTGKFPRTDTSVSLGTFVPLVVENYGFAADPATNLPQIFEPYRSEAAFHSSALYRLI